MDKFWLKVFSLFLVGVLVVNTVLFASGTMPLLWFWLIIGFAFVTVKVLF